MITESYIYDTYALIEIMKKNPNYLNYTKKHVIINNFIFAEYCYALIKNNVKDRGDLIEEVKLGLKSVEPRVIIEAMKFRYENKNKKLSMADCISYIQAKELGVKFLTGDKEFENVDNVEYVK